MKLFSRKQTQEQNLTPDLASQQKWLLDHGYYDPAYVNAVKKKYGDAYVTKIADGLTGKNTTAAFNNAKAAGWNLSTDRFVQGNATSGYSPKEISGSIQGRNKAYAYNPETQSWEPTTYCAKWANDSLRHYKDSKGRPRYTGDEITGHAWTRLSSGIAKMLYSGYDGTHYDRSAYSDEASDTRNHLAADTFKENFNTESLDKDKVYLVNMYYDGSHKRKDAWENGKKGITGTHTGNLYFDPHTNTWQVSHNIYGTVRNDSYDSVLGGKNKKGYGITAIAEARERDYGLFSGVTNKLKQLGILENGGKLIPRFYPGGEVNGGTLDAAVITQIDPKHAKSEESKEFIDQLNSQRNTYKNTFGWDEDTYAKNAALAVNLAQRETKSGNSLRYKGKQLLGDKAITQGKTYLSYITGEPVDENSQGLTQIKINKDISEHPELAQQYENAGITAQNVAEDPRKSADATMIRLNYISQQLGDNAYHYSDGEKIPEDLATAIYWNRGKLTDRLNPNITDKKAEGATGYARRFDHQRLISRN